MMNSANASFAYQQSTAHGASPLGQVVALYDTILRDFRRALAAIERGDVETRVFETNHALAVVAHLENVLDHKSGGEAAKHLSSFYKVTRVLIMEASVNSSRDALGKLIEQYKLLRDAWHQVELQSPAATAPSLPAASQPIETGAKAAPASSPVEAAEMPQATWSA